MSGIVNKVKNALHSDKDTTHTTTTTHSTTHPTGTHTGTTEGIAGPHGSRAANAADPRVDSDLDGSRNIGGTHNTTGGLGGSHATHGTTGGLTGAHNTHTGPGLAGNHNTHSNTTGLTGAGHSTNTTAGPHGSDVLNKADPRIDSDLDNRGAHNVHGTHGGLTGTGAHNTTHTGPALTGAGHNTHSNTTGLTGAGHSTNTTAGPHGSDLLNKADPRVDSDLSKTTHGTHTTGTHAGSGLTGTGAHTTGTHTAGTHTTGTHAGTGLTGTHAGNTHTTHTGTTGGISHSQNAGPHNSNVANKADPRVDSDLDGRGNRHGAATGGILGASGSHATAGSGTAQNTAGPHNSDLLNKLDPRVDSDRDGSKTVGGNKTHA